MNKEELRKLIKDKRKNILNKKELSTIIVNKLISLDIYKEARVIALYNSLDSEVDTSYLINESLKSCTTKVSTLNNSNKKNKKIN